MKDTLNIEYLMINKLLANVCIVNLVIKLFCCC